MNKEFFMKEAIKLSRNNIKEQNGGPFGAIIVKNWEIIGNGYNHVVKNNDPTAHGEIMAIRDACQKLGTFDLSWTEIYTSCEPCPMCLWAIYRSRIEKIYYGNTEKDAAEIWFDDAFFYEELEKDKHKRKIHMEQLLHTEAYEIFKQRTETNKDIHY